MKNKESTSLRSVSQKTNQGDLDPSSMYAWVLPGALKLFKEVGNRVFDASDPMALRRCLDDIENNSELGPAPYKQLWDKCVQVNKEFFSKQQMEQQSKGGAVPADKLKALGAFSNWDQMLKEEYKALMGGSQNKMIINDCNQNFEKTRGNVYDLMNILQKPDYFGMKFSGNKNQQFIDSQYSIYRQTIAPGSFKRLNDASDTLLSTYNKSIGSIAGAKRGIPKAPGPYDQKALKDNRQEVMFNTGKKFEKKLDHAVYALLVFGEVGKINTFAENAFAQDKPTMSQVNEWYDKVLKKETITLENQSCQMKYLKAGKEVNGNLENDDGLEAFKSVATNPGVSDLWIRSNGLLVLGDIVDTGATKLLMNGKVDNQKKWIQRLKCGWNVFFKTLEKFNAARVAPLNLKNSTNSDFKVMMNSEYQIITGGDSKAIDIDVEKKIYQKVKFEDKDHDWFKYETNVFGPNTKKNWNTISYTPKLTTISFKQFWNVQFLDFNSAVLSCLGATAEEYKKCAGHHADILEHKDALAYLERVYLAIFKMKEDELKVKTWRVMRSTIPPFNSELGDPQFYFKDFTVGANKINLFKVMNEKAIEIFIASGIQNAQVISFPYGNNYKYADPTKCDDKATAISGCWETKPGKLDAVPTSSTMCSQKMLNYDLPVRDLTNSAQKVTMLHVFIVGNSGKDLIPVRSGKMTGGILIWSRSMKQSTGGKSNNGVARFVFGRPYVQISFYEVQAETNQMQETVKITVAPSAIPKPAVTQAFLDGKCK